MLSDIENPNVLLGENHLKRDERDEKTTTLTPFLMKRNLNLTPNMARSKEKQSQAVSLAGS